MRTEVKEYYDMLLTKGELKEVFPAATGVWEKDSALFHQNYEEAEAFINNVSMTFDSLGESVDDYFEEDEGGDDFDISIEVDF